MRRPVRIDIILALLMMLIIIIFWLAIFEFVLFLFIIICNYYIRGGLLAICCLARGREVFTVDSSDGGGQVAAFFVSASTRVG